MTLDPNSVELLKTLGIGIVAILALRDIVGRFLRALSDVIKSNASTVASLAEANKAQEVEQGLFRKALTDMNSTNIQQLEISRNMASTLDKIDAGFAVTNRQFAAVQEGFVNTNNDLSAALSVSMKNLLAAITSMMDNVEKIVSEGDLRQELNAAKADARLNEILNGQYVGFRQVQDAIKAQSEVQKETQS